MENRKIKILAIDDNRDNLISVKAIIAEVLPQSVVYMELSGQSGIESARKIDPDVILLDIVMPGMDGYQVCKTLKADKQLSETPIIFLTAIKGDKQSRILALEAGGEAFLFKPIDATELKAQILAILKIKEAAKFSREQRLQLEELVQKRTEELKSANIAALNLLEDLKAENEIRKQSEEALKMSKELLSETESIGKVGGWSFNIDTLEQKWTDEVYRIHEVEISPEPGIDAGINYYTRESRPIIEKAVQRAIDHGENYDLELEIITAKGNTRAVHTIGKADLKNRRIYGFFQDITERKQAEQALFESEEMMRSSQSVAHICSYSTNLIVDDIAKSAWTCSPEFYEIFGVDKTYPHTIEGWAGFIHPDFREEMVAYHEFVIKEKIRFEHEYKIIRINDGAERWVYGTGELEFDEKGNPIRMHGAIQDITQRKQAEEKLILLNRAVEASSVSVVINDAEGNINYVNPYFTQLTGYSYKEALGKNPRILKSGHQSKEFYKDLWNTILSGREWTGEFQNKKKNGELYWEKAVISPILNSKGKITNFVAIKDDITEWKKILDELVDAKEHAEESDRLKSAFLANMSHEIRTPMNGILGFAELLKEPDLTGDEQQKYIEIIEKSGMRMLSIINDIIDISKIESGLMNVVIVESNINEQIEFVYTFFKPEAETKGIKLSIRTTLPKKEAVIKTDREKVYAILNNLVKNALKYTPAGSIEFGYDLVETDNYPSQTYPSQTYPSQPYPSQPYPSQPYPSLQFFVKDSGIGIPKERQEDIFERFIQADIADKMAFQGAGLGLSISKAYAEMLGGKIWVESEAGKGSIFYFTLPYNTGQAAETIDHKLPTSGKNL